MNSRNTTATFDIPQIMLDIITLIVSFFISFFISSLVNNQVELSYHLWMLAVYSVIFVLSMMLGRMYNLTTFYYTDRVIIRSLASVTIAAACTSMVIFLNQLVSSSRLMFGLFCAISFLLVVVRRIMQQYARSAFPAQAKTQALFIGDNATYSKYTHYLNQTAMRCHFVNILDYQSNLLSDPKAFEDYLLKSTLDEVVIEYSQPSQFDHTKYMKICEEMGLTVRLIWDMDGMDISEKYVSSIGTFPVVTYHSVSFNQVQIFFKNILDFIAALFGILILSPVYILTALAIRIESPGPVLFKQKRVGTNGKVFEIYKFRSMCIDAEAQKQNLMKQNKVKDGMMFKMDNDPRITKVGAFIRKTSIDELPQFFNVVKGDMSLVGTRPPTLDEFKKYNPNQRRRISIKPGITGMWQVSGRSNIVDFDKVVELDQDYIDNWSLLLDIKLLFKTVAVVLRHSGAY